MDKAVEKRTRATRAAAERLDSRLKYLRSNRAQRTADRCEEARLELSRTKEVIDSLYTLVAGAIGETSVVRALEGLPDDYYLINDFSLRFDPPIFDKKERDRIYSVQIDHVLIGRSGVFLLETKHWSSSSVENLDLRSPVRQVKRTGFALFVLLNSDSSKTSLRLSQHHWGAKKVPIRSIIVMTNEKPREEFKYVKVLSLSDLIGYVEYFDHVLSADDARIIFEFLKVKM